ncbi:MAG: ABC transporter substrate-binding protein [Bdellovibrionota bacterium]
MKMLLLFLLVPMSALASAQKPQEVVQSIFTLASAPEVATNTAKQAEVNAAVDFNTLAKSAMGNNFKALTPKDFEWFRSTLQEIIGRTVYPKAPDFLKDVKINYADVKETGNSATVKSSVQNKADLTDVDYKLQKSSDGAWHVVDVSISGVSWVESIRDQVTQVMKKKKFQGLKDAMSKRLANLKAGKA